MLAALIPRLRSLLITFWVGSLWTVGYVVAPLLFATLTDRAQAGTLAGLFFKAEAWISLICGALLLAIIWTQKEHPTRTVQIKLVTSMILCTVIGYFGLQPYMAELRAIAAQSGGIVDDAMRSRFGMLHGVASAIYLIQSLLAVGLVLKSK
jgi:MFS family permease